MLTSSSYCVARTCPDISRFSDKPAPWPCWPAFPKDPRAPWRPLA